MTIMEKRYEEYAYVLDFLSHGKPGFRPTGRAGYRAGALIQCVGEEFFTLLEALVKEGLMLKPATEFTSERILAKKLPTSLAALVLKS